MLHCQHYPDTKARRGCYKKRKLKASITDVYIGKNPQQNSGKTNSTAHQNSLTSWSSEIYAWITNMSRHTQMDKCGIH